MWYYRIVTVDRIGYRTQLMEVSGVLLEYLILDLTTSPPPVVNNEPQLGIVGELPGWLPLALLALLALVMAGGGASDS